MGEASVQGPNSSPTFREVQRKLTLSLEDLCNEGKRSGDTDGRRKKNRKKSPDAEGRPARRRRTRDRAEDESDSKTVTKEAGDPPPKGTTPGAAKGGPPPGAPPTSPVPPPGFHPYPPPWGYVHPGRPPLGPMPGMPPLDMYGRPAYDPRRPYPGVPVHGPPPRGFAPHPGMLPYPYAHHAPVPGMPGFEARAPPRPGYEPYPSPHGARPHHPVDARERPEGHAPVPGGPPPPRAPAQHHPAHATHPPPQAGPPPPAHPHHAQSSQPPTHNPAVSRQAPNGTTAVLTAAPKRVGYQIRLSNVPPELTAKDLAEAFCEVSQSRVESVDVLRDGDGRANGQAVVIFNSMADAQNAVQRYHGGDLNGRRLQVVIEGEVAHP